MRRSWVFKKIENSLFVLPFSRAEGMRPWVEPNERLLLRLLHSLKIEKISLLLLSLEIHVKRTSTMNSPELCGPGGPNEPTLEGL